MRSNNYQNPKIINMVYIALFTVLITICTWISIPTVVPFTLQTFAIFCTLGLLGGKRGTLSILLYILLGTIGIPVFSGFSGGPGKLFGATGGYILGFLLSGLLFWLISSIFGTKTPILAISMLFGLILCYFFGTLWFLFVYSSTMGTSEILSVLSMCVFPFILPDLLKIVLALLLTKRLIAYIPPN